MKLYSTIKIEKFGINLLNELEKEFYLIANQALAMSANYAPVATGALAKSFLSSGIIKTEVKNEKQLIVAFGSPLWGKPQGYGAYVEFGTKPHWPPLEPLINWVWQKGLHKLSTDVEYVGGKVRKVKGQSTRDYQQAKIMRIARAIQRKIGFKGTKPKLYVAEALKRLGLIYKQVTNETDIFYAIDPTNWLQRRGFLNRIK